MSSENFDNVAISSRIRLARNVSGFNFFTKLKSEEDAGYIVRTFSNALMKFGDFDILKLKDLSLNECNALLERHLISKELIENKDISAVALSPDEHLIVMMNEEDHIREQCIAQGFNLYRPYREIKALDDALLLDVDVAYSPEYGFLTASPANLGTGMRASVMLFLPALARVGDMELVRKETRSLGLTVRGLYGEGTGASGAFYQISNQNSLGLSEQEILDCVAEYVFTLCEMELSAREDVLAANHDQLRDEICRAYGILSECHLLSEEEMIERLAQIRFGDALGFLKISDLKAFDKLLFYGAKANLHENFSFEGKEEKVRSEYINRKVKELVKKV